MTPGPHIRLSREKRSPTRDFMGRCAGLGTEPSTLAHERAT